MKQKVEIEKIKNSKNKITYYVMEGRQAIGSVSALFKKINNSLIKYVGCKKGTLGCYIERFYPNGDPELAEMNYSSGNEIDSKILKDIDQRMRKGIGSKVLTEILKDCKNAQIPFIWLQTSEDCMKNFCLKHGFFGFRSLQYQDPIYVKELGEGM